jgi:hypothetical protein
MLTLLGEVHGTCEAPAEVLRLAREALEAGPVHVGLEIPVGELHDGPFWRRPDDRQDGRSSVAMRELIVALEALGVHVFAFDHPDPADGRTRDEAMADEVSRVVDGGRAEVIVLAGNLHPRRVPGGVPSEPGYEWMGVHLERRHDFVAWELTCREGTAWCQTLDGAGPRGLRAPDQGDERRLVRYSARDERGYDGELYVPVVTASPPWRAPRR